MSKCPEGKILNPITGKCVNIGGKIGKALLAQSQHKPQSKQKIESTDKQALKLKNKEGLFLVSKPMILVSKAQLLYYLYEPSAALLKELPISDLKLGYYKLTDMKQGIGVVSHETVTHTAISQYVENLKLHNPIDNSTKLSYLEYGGVLQSVMWKHKISDQIQQDVVLHNPAMILIDPDYYQSLKTQRLSQIINIFPKLENETHHMTNKYLIWKCHGHTSSVIINHSMIATYGDYTSLYTQDFLIKDTKGLYSKPFDYDSKVEKQNIINDIIENNDSTEILTHLYGDDGYLDLMYDLVMEKLNPLDSMELKKIKEDLATN